MKQIIIALLTCITLTAKAQQASLSDSIAKTPITLQVTQFFAVKLLQTLEDKYANRSLIEAVKVYAGSGNNPDSLINVTGQAIYFWPAIDYLMSQPTVSGYVQYAKYIENKRIGANGNAIAGYTSIQTQVVSKANNANDPQQQAAIWLRDMFLQRKAALEAVDEEYSNNAKKRF